MNTQQHLTNLPRKTLPKLPQSYTQVSPVTESKLCCPDKQVEDVVCRQERNKDGLSPCSHEEADTRMMVHVADAAKQYNSVLYVLWTVMLLS